MNIQSLVVQPRYGHTRVAKTDSSQRTIGGDGKLYKLVDGNDECKFKVLSEDEMLVETRKSQEIAAAITATVKLTHSCSKPKKRVTQGPNKQQRIENKKWEETVESIKHASVISPVSSPQKAESISSMNSSAIRKSVTQDSEMVPEALLKAMTLLQSKYEKNLEVIDLLFQEKKEMENKVHVLEEKLKDNTDKFEVAIGIKEARDSHDSMILPKPSEETYSSTMAAALFGDTAVNNVPENFHPKRHRPVSASTGRSRSVVSSTINAQTHISKDDSSVISKPRSVSCDSRRSHGNFNQSMQMQASIDRYIQKKALIDQKDKALLLEQKEYEQQQRERYLRASRCGGEFKEMIIRQEESINKKESKIEKFKQERINKEEKEKEERRKAILEHVSKPIAKDAASWKEIEEMQNQRRKERSEHHKAELLMKMANKNLKGTATADTIKEKIALLQKENQEREEQARKFVAKDPAKVAQQLEASKLAYELKQQKKAEKELMLKENRKAIAQSCHNIPALLSMEERAKAHAEKLNQKKIDMQRAQEAKEKLEKDKENRRIKQLISAKIPEASLRLTKSVAYRTNMVKNSMEKEKAEMERTARLNLMKSQQEKELSAILKADIKEREATRKASVNGYVELAATQEKSAAMAAMAREAYREKLRENRRKIAGKLKDRPSLIERHELDLRRKSANSASLGTVGKVITEKNKELFSKEEKMRLGISDGDDDSLGI